MLDHVLLEPVTFVRSLARLGSATLVLEPSHLDSSFPAHSFGCSEPALFTFGQARSELLVPVLDFNLMSFLVPLRSSARLDPSMSVPDPLHSGFTPLLRSYGRLDFLAPTYGLSRAGFVSSLSAPDTTISGSSPFIRSMARLDSTPSAIDLLHLEPLLPVRSPSYPGLSLSLMSLGRFDPSASASDPALLGLSHVAEEFWPCGAGSVGVGPPCAWSL